MRVSLICMIVCVVIVILEAATLPAVGNEYEVCKLGVAFLFNIQLLDSLVSYYYEFSKYRILFL